MKRDFTTKCYEEFCALIDQIKDENWNGIADWFGDRFWKLKNFLINLGILDRTSEMETYYRELLDRKNISKTNVKQVFEDISTLDSSYAGNGSGHFGCCTEYLTMFRLCLSALTHVTADAARTGNISTALSSFRMKSLLQEPWLQLKGHPLSGSLFTQPFSLLQLNDIPQEYMDAYIRSYENIHADLAKTLDQALAGFDVADAVKKHIKFMIYFGEEPYCSILNEIIFDAKTHYYQGKRLTDLSFEHFSSHYKDTYVTLYELLHPDRAKILSKALSDSYWENDQQQDVKFLTYCSPEPYRSIYFKYVDRLRIVLFPEYSSRLGIISSTGYFRLTKTLYIEDIDSTFQDNPLGPYNPVYHESGHAVDNFTYQSEDTLALLSHNYEFNGKQFFDYIEADVRNYVRNKIDEVCPALNEESKQKILVSLNLSDESSFDYSGNTDGLSRLQIAYRQMVVDAMYEDLRGEIDSSASDVFGGITNNAILGDWKHYKSSDTKPEEFTYWYSEDGTSTNTTKKIPTGKQASELWAEFFAAQMTHDEEELASIKKHFPTAYPVLEELAREMAAK